MGFERVKQLGVAVWFLPTSEQKNLAKGVQRFSPNEGESTNQALGSIILLRLDKNVKFEP